jgi:hypothetical protein
LQDLRMLRRHRLIDDAGAAIDVVLCANDAAVAGRRLLTLDELVAELRGPAALPQVERRAGVDRRRAPEGVQERRAAA